MMQEAILRLERGCVSILNGLATSIVTGERANLFVIPNDAPQLLLTGEDVDATEALMESMISSAYFLHKQEELQIFIASKSNRLLVDGTSIKLFDSLEVAVNKVLDICEENRALMMQSNTVSVRDYALKQSITLQHIYVVLDLDTCEVTEAFRLAYTQLSRIARSHGIFIVLKSKNVSFSDDIIAMFDTRVLMHSSIEVSEKLLDNVGASLILRPDHGVIKSTIFKYNTLFNYVPLKIFNVRRI